MDSYLQSQAVASVRQCIDAMHAAELRLEAAQKAVQASMKPVFETLKPLLPPFLELDGFVFRLKIVEMSAERIRLLKYINDDLHEEIRVYSVSDIRLPANRIRGQKHTSMKLLREKIKPIKDLFSECLLGVFFLQHIFFYDA